MISSLSSLRTPSKNRCVPTVKKPKHQQPLYWPRFPGIFRLQYGTIRFHVYVRDHLPLRTTLRTLWASCQIRKMVGCACAGNTGNVFPRHRLQRKQLVSDPGMHHGTYTTHVPWCIPGSLTRGVGEHVPGIPDAWASRHVTYLLSDPYTNILRPRQNTSISRRHFQMHFLEWKCMNFN